MLIIDEAYAEFAGTSFLHLADAYENIIIVKTLSKACGFAGVRVGIAVGNPALIAQGEKMQPPFHLSTLTQVAIDTVLEYT